MTLYILGAAILGSLVLFSVSTNPITRLAFVILAFFFSGLLYIDLGSPFLGLSLIIVYVGAIAVLFLFIIKLVPTLSFHTQNPETSPIPVSKVGRVMMFFYFIYISLPIHSPQTKQTFKETPSLLTLNWEVIVQDLTDLFLYGYWLFQSYFTSTVILSLILFIVLIGVIALTLK